MRVLFVNANAQSGKLDQVRQGWNTQRSSDEIQTVVFNLDQPLQTLAAHSPQAALEYVSVPSNRGGNTAIPAVHLADTSYVDTTGLEPDLSNPQARYCLASGSSTGIGQAIRWLISNQSRTGVLFAGLSALCDGGVGALRALGADLPMSQSDWKSDLAQVATLLQQHNLVIATNTDRPFSGLDGLGPLLGREIDNELAASVMNTATVSANRIERAGLGPKLLGPGPQPGFRSPGAAAGGGAAGALMCMGVRHLHSNDLLAQTVALDQYVKNCELAVVFDHELNPLNIGLSASATVAQVCGQHATAVAAVSPKCDLNRRELAKFGIHGHYPQTPDFFDLGRHLARTWSPCTPSQ